MGRKSSLKTLPPAILQAVEEAFQRGCTIEAVTEMLGAADTPRSRSAVGRFAKDYAEVTEEKRRSDAIASAWMSEFKGVGDEQGRMLAQIISTLLTKQMMTRLADEEADTSVLELMRAATAANKLEGTMKASDERLRLKRNETLAEAAKAAETEARSAGASDLMIDKIKARLLGLST